MFFQYIKTHENNHQIAADDQQSQPQWESAEKDHGQRHQSDGDLIGKGVEEFTDIGCLIVVPCHPAVKIVRYDRQNDKEIKI